MTIVHPFLFVLAWSVGALVLYALGIIRGRRHPRTETKITLTFRFKPEVRAALERFVGARYYQAGVRGHCDGDPLDNIHGAQDVIRHYLEADSNTEPEAPR